MSRLSSRKLSVLASYIYDGAGNKPGTRSRISYFSDRPLTTYAIQEPCRAEDHDYIGNYEFKDGQVHRVNTPYGYMAMGMFFTYLRDYQGNNRNHANYYAYGLPVQGSDVKDSDPYLYSGKEFYSLRGVNLYDFNARTYAPDIARFMQPDPLATENHGVSPYVYCLSDPINFIDPTGEKVYYVDMTGRIISSEEAGTYNSLNMKDVEAQYEGRDVVLIIDKDGKIINQSETFEEGTIKLHDNSMSALKGKDITLLEINDKKAARAVFEMLSKRITGSNSIEFGINIMDDGASNDVFTGHKQHKLEGFNDVFLMRLEQGHTFTDLDHSHTNDAVPSDADMACAKWVHKQLKLKGKQKNMPRLSVFESWGGRYYPYILKKKRKK